MRAARRFLVSGRVQGVGYRMFARDAALAEGLSGLARNLEDGRVEVYVEGEAEALDRFEARLRQGPPLARVAGVEVETEIPGGRQTGFRIA